MLQKKDTCPRMTVYVMTIDYVRLTIIVKLPKYARGGFNGCMYRNACTNKLVFIVLVDWRSLRLSLL